MITIRSTDEPGVRIVDEIEKVQCHLWTGESVTPDPVDPDESAIFYPVDSVVRFEASEVTVPLTTTVHVRNADGSYNDTYNPNENQLQVSARHQIDIPAPVKLYVVADTDGRLVAGDDVTTLEFETTATVELGVRSLHSKPAGTITCRRTPESLMAAISAFSSSLKMTSCERSYPSHRGHPPTLEFGDELEIPDEIEPPETGITIEVPPYLEYIYPVAPLAYYLGADLVPGPEPVLDYQHGQYLLSRPPGYQETVIETLRGIHFLDCMVRTEGLFELELAVEEEFYDLIDVTFDTATLYDQPLTEQVATYVDVLTSTPEFDRILPSWSVCVDVTPEFEHARAFPYLLDELPLIRTKTHDATFESDPTFEDPVDDFLRSDTPDDLAEALFELADAPATTHSYLGHGIALEADNLTLDSLQRRQADRVRSDPRISVAVVCNDPMMSDESIVETYYGLRDLIQFDVEDYHELTTDELAELLESEFDLIHYIGHVEKAGLRCEDGLLDVRSLPKVNTDAVLLNGCTSYEQGQALVEAGASASVVTVSSISNGQATKVGRAIARALNCGFTLRSALHMVSKHAPTLQYSIVGDGSLEEHSASKCLNVIFIEQV